MASKRFRVIRWSSRSPADEASLRKIYRQEHLDPYLWSNGPGDRYGNHHHSYHKVIFVVHGSITFNLPQTGESVTLEAGDRLDLPAGVEHGAVVGAQGVACLEAHGRSSGR